MINKHQAASLWANGYRLVDKEDKVYEIDCVANDGITLTHDGEDYRTSLDAKEIGKNMFILARPLSDLTTEITHDGEKFIPILNALNFLNIKYHSFDIKNNSVDLKINYGRQGKIKNVRFWYNSFRGNGFNCSDMGFLMYRDTEGASDLLKQWHFNIGFPEEAVKPLKD